MVVQRRTWFKTIGTAGLGAALMGAPLTTYSASQSGRLRLGLVTYNLARDWDLSTILKNCEETGFEGVELRTTHAHNVEVNLTPDQRAEIKRRFEDSPVELIGLGSAFDYHTPDQDRLRRDIEATKEYIVLCHDVGGPGVKVRPNDLPEGVPIETTLEQIGRSLRELGEFCEDYGVVIRLEVHGRGTSQLPHIRTIMEIADHPNVGVCWNSNTMDLAGAGFEANFDMVKDWINAVHMRDLYDAEYPYRRLFEKLNEIGFDGFCMAEIQGSGDPVRIMRYYRGIFLALQNLL